MPSFRSSRIVPWGPEAMFDLVADVERYPEFLPLCEELTVRSRKPGDNGTEVILATLTAGYGLIQESFTSKVLLDRPALRILVEYVNGPFKRLENRWSFAEHAAGGSEVEFFIAYEFRSLPLQMLMGSMFEKAFGRFADAFEERAEVVYGRPDRASAEAAT
jgi:coenzyme Q-binding protein COQ10